MAIGALSFSTGAELYALYGVAAGAAEPPPATPAVSTGPEPRPNAAAYRAETVELLQRYMRLSLQVGRLPSGVGREFFRAHSSYLRPHTFEDAVIFVIDVERCLARLDAFSQQLIARVVLQDYSEEDAAALLGCGLRTVERRLPEALDEISEIFLNRKLIS